ncbi:MAG: hypothetical protein QXQ41_05805 [Candidatus Bathyarchaeia archaeon]
MKSEVSKQIRQLQIGDLIRVEWNDASVGKSLSGGVRAIDVPVFSIGVFIGVLGEKNKHIILGQNHFRYANGLYDIDYTAIPVSWAVKIAVIAKNHVSIEEANQLLSSFLMGSRRPMRQSKQQRIINHGS